jgi:uncharacterized membrane protein YeaQ/YmgE (transglycosylase-associated protein family)
VVDTDQKNDVRASHKRRRRRVMTLSMFMSWVLMGVLAGGLADTVMKRGGYGLRCDMLLGLAGSVVASGIFLALTVSPQSGVLTMAAVAFIGAAVPIVAQRKAWPSIA